MEMLERDALNVVSKMAMVVAVVSTSNNADIDEA
jgi:hypothetical protein